MIIKVNDLVNEGIRAYEVRLITNSGEQVVMSKEAALAKAKDEGLDLVIVSPEAKPPVAKLLNYGQYRYQKEKKQKDTKKKSNQKSNIVKELKLSPRIGEHDFQVRVKHCRDFLAKGHKVKLTIFFKGREAAHRELGHVLIEKFLATIEDLGWADSPDIRPGLLGKMMSILIIAGKKKPDPQAELLARNAAAATPGPAAAATVQPQTTAPAAAPAPVIK